MKALKGKTVQESAVDKSVFQCLWNSVWGNESWGFVTVSLWKNMCYTAAVDSMHFLNPAGQGDILLFSAAINHTWKTSMKIGVLHFYCNE